MGGWAYRQCDHRGKTGGAGNARDEDRRQARPMLMLAWRLPRFELLPVDPLPVDPLPVDPLPVDPLPVDPLPVEPVPVDPLVLIV